MPSETLVLTVANSEGAAQVTIEERSGGAPIGPFKAPLGPVEYDWILGEWTSVKQRLRSWESCRDTTIAIGTKLFNATLGADDDAQRLYTRSIERVELGRQSGDADLLRIAVSCHHERFGRLPWELLFDSHATSTGRGFLGATDYVSIQRAGNLLKPGGWRADYTLRLLVVVATPMIPEVSLSLDDSSGPVVDTLALYRFIERLKHRSGSVLDISFLAGRDANPNALQNALVAGCDILYFIGHSRQVNGETWFLLEDGSPLRRSERISAKELASVLRTSGVQSVFLSSCESLAAATELARFEHLHSIVAMQAEMPIVAATVFDEAVIRAIVARCSIERSVQRGRREICSLVRKVKSDPEWEPTDRPEWAIPVLYINGRARETTSAAFEDGVYRVGADDRHVEALQQCCGLEGDLPVELTKYFRPSASRELRGFALAHGLVTNDQYRYYLEQTHVSQLPHGFDRSGESIELGRRPGRDENEERVRPDDPVTGITRAEADACCRWFGRRLLSADEYDVGARHGALISPVSGRILEWTSDDYVDSHGVMSAVVVGARENVPHTSLLGFFAPRDPRAAYPDVGFRMAEDLQPSKA